MVSIIYHTGQKHHATPLSPRKVNFFTRVGNTLKILPNSPCQFASRQYITGSFFPPRDQTGSDIVYLWDKELCRTLPLQYRGPVEKTGIKADLYTPSEVVFGGPNVTNSDNKCFCYDTDCPPQGLQDISPCQYSKCYVSLRGERDRGRNILRFASHCRRTGLPLFPTLLSSGS